MSQTGKSKLGNLAASKSSGHSTSWKISLVATIVVGISRLVLLLRPGMGPTASTAATIITIWVVGVAAVVIPMEVMRARSAEQVARAKANSPGAVVVAAIRSPLGKYDFDWIDPSFRLSLFYTLSADSDGLVIWEGGRKAKPALLIGRELVSSIGTTNLRMGTVIYPALRIVFNDDIEVPAAVAERYPTQFTTELFVRKPNRPQRPRPVDEVNAAANELARALG